ncbi:MAG: exosortase A [Rubrivivax sp.]|nr:exosortase A [Rubrivivax sp.]
MGSIASPAPAATPAMPWRSATLALAAVWLVLGLLYAETVTTMVGIWYRSETFAHAFLVAPISAWLVWRLRSQLARLHPGPQPWLLLGLVIAAAVWLLADLVKVNSASQLAWMAMLVISVPAVLGTAVASAILFPLLFLFFAVPVGEFMLPYMMEWTADFTVAALRLTGIPVYREGLQFVIPSGNWSVVEACSGVRYLIASFMVGSLFAYLNYRSTKRRVIFMLASLLIPILANWLRAYMIVMLGHLSGNTIAVGVDHLLYGWVFFGVVVMLMFYVGGRWSEPDDLGAGSAAADGPESAVARATGSRALLLTGLLAIGILVAPHLIQRYVNAPQPVARDMSLNLPAQLSTGWQKTAANGWDFRPTFINPSTEIAQNYAGAQGEVGVYIAYYRGQSLQRKLVSSVNVLVPSSDRQWNQLAAGSRGLLGVGGLSSVRTATILGKQGGTTPVHLVAWRVYWVDGQWIASDSRAQVVGALGRLLGRGDDGAALVIHTSSETPEQGHQRLETFLKANLGAIEALLLSRRSAL